MTAVQLVMFETKASRLARERQEWIDEAVAYMLSVGLYLSDEVEGAIDLAENLHYSCIEENGEMHYTAKEAVDEELSCWGD